MAACDCSFFTLTSTPATSLTASRSMGRSETTSVLQLLLQGDGLGGGEIPAVSVVKLHGGYRD